LLERHYYCTEMSSKDALGGAVSLFYSVCNYFLDCVFSYLLRLDVWSKPDARI